MTTLSASARFLIRVHPFNGSGSGGLGQRLEHRRGVDGKVGRDGDVERHVVADMAATPGQRRVLGDDERRVDKLEPAPDVTRGLLLDLIATGDGEGVDAAYERFLTLLAAAGVARERAP